MDGVDVIVYRVSPVTSDHERSIDVCCGLLVLRVGTAAGIVKYEVEVLDVGLVPDALTDTIVNV
jgi:hypothetical protein